jgi:MFS family permease
MQVPKSAIAGDPTTELSPEAQRVALRRITLRIMPFLFLLYIIAYIDRVNVSFAQLEMGKALHLSDRVYGTGAGIFFLGYFLFEVPSNLILERFGARRWICRIMLTWGVIAIAMAFIRNPVAFYAMRFLLGIAEAGFFPGIILYLTYWYTAADRARIIGILMTATSFAFILGGPVSGYILKYIHGFGLQGWQWLFVIEGFPALILGFVVLTYLSDGPKDAKWLPDHERRWLAHRIDSEPRVERAHDAAAWKRAIEDPIVLRLAGLYLSMVLGMYGVSMWLPIIIKGLAHSDDFRTGLLTCIPHLGGAIAMVINGWHSDRTGERRMHLAIPALAGTLSLVFAAMTHDATARFWWLVAANSSMSAVLGPFWAMPPAFLSRRGAAGGIAVVNSIGNLGGFAGPFLVGYVKQQTHSFSGGIYVLAASMFIAVVQAVLMPDPRRAVTS